MNQATEEFLRAMSPDRAWIDRQWDSVRELVGRSPEPRYYDRDEVVEAEKAGRVSVPDAVLGRVLATDPSADRRQQTTVVVETVAAHLRHDQVVNRCHNLALELFMMCDQLGIPSAILWGTLWAESLDGEWQFVLSPYVGAASDQFRPGHSWLITPEFTVIDVALKHQADVEGDYQRHQETLPRVIRHETAVVGPKPDRAWFRSPAGGRPISYSEFEDALKYSSALGWVEIEVEGLRLRYVPNAVGLPNVGDDLHRALPLIDGETPMRFFRKKVRRALRDQ